MAAVAAEAGVSRRGLHLHFPDRPALLIGLRRYVDEHYDLAESIHRVWTAADATTALDEWARHLTGYHARIRGLVLAIDAARRNDDAAAALWDEASGRWREACTRLAEHIAASGALGAGWTVPTASDVLYSWMVAFNALWEALVVESGWTPAEFQRHLSAAFADLLRPRGD